MSADSGGESPDGLPPAVTDDLIENEEPQSLAGQGAKGRPTPLITQGRSRSLNDLRFRLSRSTLLLVAAEGLGSMALLFFLPKDRVDLLREILPLVFAPIVALVSTSFAWFFASESKGDSNPPPQ